MTDDVAEERLGCTWVVGFDEESEFFVSDTMGEFEGCAFVEVVTPATSGMLESGGYSLDVEGTLLEATVPL